MQHREYKKINSDATTAVLFIHGIVGTPNHFKEMIPLIVQPFSVYNLLLDGHGKGAKEFSGTSMEKWETQVAAAVEELSATHERIYIVAHSLGTLLAIEQAVKNKKICKLFLLAVPLALRLKAKMVGNAAKVYFEKVSENDPEALAAKNSYGIENDKNPFHYIGWIPRFLELFAKIRKTRKLIPLLDTDCRAYQSSKDEMVSRKSEEYLRQNRCISIHALERSGHYYYDQSDWEYLLREFEKMLRM